MIRSYLRLVSSHPRYIGFGFLHYFFSGLGQTFLISFFVPHFNEAFAIDNSSFGYLYSAATVCSALTFPYAGGMIDRFPLRYLSVANGLFLTLFCLITALAPHYLVLFLGLYGLRFTGQGFMVLIGSTGLARFFDAERGRSLSLASFGLSLSEGLMPTIVTLLAGLAGWRNAWLILPVFVLGIFVPLAITLIRKQDTFQWPPRPKGEGGPEGQAEKEITEDEEGSQKGPQTPDATRKEVIRDPRFWLLVPGSMFLPFFITGMFIHQNLLAEAKGWSMEWMSTCFVAYFVSRIISYILAGPLIDRFGARRVFIFYLLPLLAGMNTLLIGDHPMVAMVYLFLAGLTASLAAVTNTAMWAEIYGTSHLGAIKSVVTMLMVLSTALGAVVIGPILEHRSIAFLATVFSAVILLLMSIGFFTVRRVERERGLGS